MFWKKGIILSSVLILVFFVLLLGCKQQVAPLTTTQAPTAAPTVAPKATPTQTTVTPQSGGILRVIDKPGSRGPGWPVDATGFDNRSAYPCFESLWIIDMNENLVPLLAESWDIAQGWKSVTFHLRKGVKFHDGTDWNATAAKYNLELYKTAQKAGTDAWASIDIIDDYTIRLNLSSFQNTQRLSIGFVEFVSPTAVQKNGTDWARWNPVGTGPFKIKGLQKDVFVECERWDGYWGKKPYLDGVKFLAIADQLQQYNVMAAGDAEVHLIEAGKFTNDLKNAGFNVDYLNVAGISLVPDTKNADSPFTDKRVRQAVDYAMDRDGICKTLLYGQGIPLYQLCIPGYYGYNPDIEGRKYDPVKAKQLLADAGYPNGFKTTLNTDTRTGIEFITAIQSNLKDVGINADINQLTTGQQADMAGKSGWRGLMVSPTSLFGGEVLNAGFRGYDDIPGNQVSLKRSPGYLDTLYKALQTDDLSVRNELCRQLAKIIYDDTMMIYVYQSGVSPVYAKGVHDVNFFRYNRAAPNNTWNVGGAWMEKKTK